MIGKINVLFIQSTMDYSVFNTRCIIWWSLTKLLKQEQEAASIQEQEANSQKWRAKRIIINDEEENFN